MDSPVFKNKTLIKGVWNNLLYSSIFSNPKEEAVFSAFKLLRSLYSANSPVPSAFSVPFPPLPQRLGNSGPRGTGVGRGLALPCSMQVVCRPGAAPLMPGETVGAQRAVC